MTPGYLLMFKRTATNLRAELAIFVRQLDTQAQYYTMSGRWLQQNPKRPNFFVPHFVKPSDLKDLLAFLPDKEVPEVMQNRLQALDHSLPRAVGSKLVEKMLKFWNDSDTAYRAAAAKFDNAHSHIAAESQMKYLSLDRLAAKLVPELRDDEEQFPPHVLYAVHRAIMQDDLGFRVQRAGNHRAWGEYEISSLEDVQILVAVTNAVRRYQEYTINSARGSQSPDCKGFLSFIARAKGLIEQSRASRAFTAHGMLSPIGHAEPQAQSTDMSEITFTGGDKFILRFIESWCGLRTFNASSNLNGVASAILRATGMYDDVPLDQSTGWVFLQEVGALPAWTNLATYDARLPVKGNKLRSPTLVPSTKGLRPDAMSDLRKDWGDMPVFCIDSISASEIDDGVSLEHTDQPGEYWLHVHTANPSSGIKPHSSISAHARSMAQNIYFPEDTTMMLPEAIVKERFSLAAGRPTLTFSAKVDSRGEILDYNVTNGIINNVIYMTPETFDEVAGIGVANDDANLILGNLSNPAKPDREMTGASDLRDPDKAILRTLYDICRARLELTSRRGAISLQNAETSVVVHNESAASIDATAAADTGPQIAVQVQHAGAPRMSAVAQMMLLAGNVAARFCHDRGIPIPFRASQQNLQKPDPAKYFSQHILPLVNKGANVSRDTVLDYIRLLGPILPSTTAGPHLALGMDMYTKATSPLRRYCDLVVHWQIEGALLYEKHTGTSLIGNTSEEWLTFTKQQIDELLPALDTRERMLKVAQRNAKTSWTLQALIRAWKYGEGSIPSSLHMRVTHKAGGKALGRIDALGELQASFVPPSWISYEDISIGSVFEVKIDDLNAYTLRASMIPLQVLHQAGAP